ncbi:Hypothetical_protein [Hexamita inflata]|uniref:Hypothetical_protein n=1 Tax=Hexamita inflata TaxID=28002 RepID=A0AA86NWJ3_9EUKA|nr:Hypothetical protein HINF_LOCUS13719 [Hexamita inflata]
MFLLLLSYQLTTEVVIDCTGNFTSVGGQCQCQSKLSSDGLQCVSKCADIGEALKEQGSQLQISKCHKCDQKVSSEDDNYCLSIQKLSAMKVCGKYARPDPNFLETQCICNDSSLVLLTNGIDCKCQNNLYYNKFYKTCLQCPNNQNPDLSQQFCLCSNNSLYFDHETVQCKSCGTGSLTSWLKYLYVFDYQFLYQRKFMYKMQIWNKVN